MSLGLASLCVPTWFNYFFTYSGSNQGLKGLIQAIVLIVEEPYLIASLIGLTLNVILPHEQKPLTPASIEEGSSNAGHEDRKDVPTEEDSWNNPAAVLTLRG